MTDEYPTPWKLVRSLTPCIVAANGTVLTLVCSMELGARIVRAVNAEARHVEALKKISGRYNPSESGSRIAGDIARAALAGEGK